ncbi:MAG: OmpA family protein [Aeromonas sp.]
MSVLLMIFALLLISALVQIAESTEKSQKVQVLIIKDINEALNNAGVKVQASQDTGDISITDSILFDVDAHELKATGKTFLNKFIPIYARAVFQSKETRNEVSRIVVEGHSSSDGSFNRNMELSVLRANSVIAFINSMQFKNKHAFFEKVIIAGRGPLEADQKHARKADRKVKFRFQFKGDNFIGQIRQVKVAGI